MLQGGRCALAGPMESGGLRAIALEAPLPGGFNPDKLPQTSWDLEETGSVPSVLEELICSGAASDGPAALLLCGPDRLAAAAACCALCERSIDACTA